MKNITAIILAAGRGTRMKSGTPKVLHEILGKPMLSHVIGSLKDAGAGNIITVVGCGHESVRKAVGGTKFVIQKKLLGSGDAVIQAKKGLGKYNGDILVICGDTPLIRAETIKSLIEKHKTSGAAATILTAKMKDPRGYGRIVRDDNKKILKITEDLEASLYEAVIGEINSGTYCFKATDLFDALVRVKPDNKKKEVFLTDVIRILRDKGKHIESVLTEDAFEATGINDRNDLAEAINALKNRILREIMSSGVTIEDPATTIIYPGVFIGRDTVIHPNTLIESDVEIGAGCRIGPFARIRRGVVIGGGAEIGNFVELVRTKIGEKTKVKHHTYLGDTIAGRCVNVGAGTITANFDGKRKNRTVIGDGASIGIGARLVAPVKIGRRATVGAGCVVPKGHDVPAGATVVGVPAKILKK
ncbi:MAG: NTP transferase domain-containing protein [Candidatus Omnitrophota bacterium]